MNMGIVSWASRAGLNRSLKPGLKTMDAPLGGDARRAAIIWHRHLALLTKA